MPLPHRARTEVSGAIDLRDALRRLARVMAPRWDVSRASLRSVDRSDDRLVIVSVWSRDGTVLTEGTRIPLEATSFPEVARSGDPVIFEDPSASPTLLDQILLDEGLQSWAVIPLREGGAITALLSVSATVPGTFRVTDADELQAVADAVQDLLLKHSAGRAAG